MTQIHRREFARSIVKFTTEFFQNQHYIIRLICICIFVFLMFKPHLNIQFDVLISIVLRTANTDLHTEIQSVVQDIFLQNNVDDLHS